MDWLTYHWCIFEHFWTIMCQLKSLFVWDHVIAYPPSPIDTNNGKLFTCVWPAWYWFSSIICVHVNVFLASLVVWQWLSCECYRQINYVFTEFYLCWVYDKSSWEQACWASKRQGIECREVVRVLHNISFVSETGSPAPVFPKNRTATYFLDNNLAKRFVGGARRPRHWQARSRHNDVSDEVSQRIDSIFSGGKGWYKAVGQGNSV